jgi:ribosomal protein L7/L12
VAGSLDPEVRAAADRGDLVEAIKLLRRKSGLGLGDAKETVESYLRGEEALPAHRSESIPVSAISALQEGRLIEAIRHTREANRTGLKESRQAVERYLDANPMDREQFLTAARRERRPLRTIFILALIVAALIVAARALTG